MSSNDKIRNLTARCASENLSSDVDLIYDIHYTFTKKVLSNLCFYKAIMKPSTR